MAVRNLANIVYRLGGGKSDFNGIWPIEGKEKETIAPISRDRWNQIKEKQKAIDQNIADARLKNRNRS